MAKMVSRILEQKEAIRLVLSADRSTSNIVPTWQDLDVLQGDFAPLKFNRYFVRRTICNCIGRASYVTYT